MNQEIKALALKLAGMEPECKGTVHDCKLPPGPLASAPPYCVSPEGHILPTCHGTGKVFVFPDSVRVPCRQIHTLMAPDLSTIRNCICAEAGCPGWTPSLDLATWCRALSEVAMVLKWNNGKLTRVMGGTENVFLEDKRRLLTALAQR